VPVIGATHELPRLLEQVEPEIVLVTIPDAPRATLDAIVAACADAGVECRFVRREIDLDPRVVLGTGAE
jgi:FlaA1/EpsC-like NDP-sugar epimerase